VRRPSRRTATAARTDLIASRCQPGTCDGSRAPRLGLVATLLDDALARAAAPDLERRRLPDGRYIVAVAATDSL
jgi:hypothetical protein